MLGPVRLADLPVFAAAAGEGAFMILPEGGAEWLPFGSTHLTPVVTAVAHVPAYVPPSVLRPPARPVPPAATAAGVLWIIFGLARLCDSFMALFAMNRLTVEAHGTTLFIIGLHLMIALLFLNAGIMVVTGKASDFGGYARVSLCFGLLGIVLVIIFPDRFPLDAWQLVVIGLLLISGLLANSSRQAYRDWKAGKPAAPRARRARRK